MLQLTVLIVHVYCLVVKVARQAEGDQKYGEERPIVCHCTHEEKIQFLSFTQNGCYGNQPHPFDALI